MTGPTVLISGAGVAGPTLAYWLLRYGFQPTLIERADAPRTQGYVIDFWGSGYEVAARMGLLPDIRAAGYDVRELRLVDAKGTRTGGFDARVFREATHERFTSLPRGDLSFILLRAIQSRAEMLFDNSIAGLSERADGVIAHFAHGTARRFDAVIGADGLHSRVRALSFGAESKFEEFLGYAVGAFEIPGYRPRDEDVYVAYAAAGIQVARFSMRDDRTMVLIVIADRNTPAFESKEQELQKRYLCRHLTGLGWESREILRGLEQCSDLYFDRVSQIRMDRWSSDRIALVGDAAYAPSLLAGQGAALGMTGAYVLAGELARAKRPSEAFARYEARLRTFMRRKQDAARRFARSFAPKTEFGVLARAQLSKLLAHPSLLRFAMGSALVDAIELPDYEDSLPAQPRARVDDLRE